MSNSDWNWDHDACVNCPVSGDVWEDVLRLVARWHMRVDLYAPRMERVCKRWKHFWQVAEGVFDVDVRRNAFPSLRLCHNPRLLRHHQMTMKDVKLFRERARMNYLIHEFKMKGMVAPKKVEKPPVPPAKRSAPIQPGDNEEARALLRAEMLSARTVRREPIDNFLASWPNQYEWRV